jgi:hypothetical protein
MDPWMEGCIGVTLLDLAASGALIAIYAGIYWKRRTSFTLALALFAAAFLVQNILFLYLFLGMAAEFSPRVMPMMFGVGLAEGTGLSAVVWTASR